MSKVLSISKVFLIELNDTAFRLICGYFYCGYPGMDKTNRKMTEKKFALPYPRIEKAF